MTWGWIRNVVVNSRYFSSLFLWNLMLVWSLQSRFCLRIKTLKKSWYPHYVFFIKKNRNQTFSWIIGFVNSGLDVGLMNKLFDSKNTLTPLWLYNLKRRERIYCMQPLLGQAVAGRNYASVFWSMTMWKKKVGIKVVPPKFSLLVKNFLRGY